MLFQQISFSQKAKSNEQPKLVVGIVVDQMRYDYLYRYWEKYGNDGFKKLMNEGFNCKNTSFNYMPTFTAPGHASIYTGATPSIHGIIGNNWYVLKEKRKIYCTDDANVKTVGSHTLAGVMSPANMLTTTITDELKISSNFKSKVIGISLKDRGAILPAGHSADAAYWYDSETGNWISSTHYMAELPAWVKQFNNKKLPSKYLSSPWNTLLPIAQYKESFADDNPFEEAFNGQDKPVFPHNLPEIVKLKGLGLLRETPFGNTFTKDFVMETVINENLGKGENTDFIAVSFSSPDYIGHQFGTHSIEIQDNYLRLDKDIAELIAFLDKQVGKENYLIFLTADHGAAHNPGFLNHNKMPAGIFDSSKPLADLRQLLNEKYGKGDWILSYYNEQFTFNRKLIFEKGIDLYQMQQFAKQYLINYPNISNVYTSQELSTSDFVHKPASLVQAGFHQQRSGDVAIVLEPGWMEFNIKGTTHGTVYNYDTHVPLIWYGWKIKKGETSEPYFITDIAPTLSVILKVSMPNGNTGTPINAVLNPLYKK